MADIPRHNRDGFTKNGENSNKKDGVHPTPMGYRLIVDHIYRYLMEKKGIGDGRNTMD